jgi:3'-5' exoribonuclease
MVTVNKTKYVDDIAAGDGVNDIFVLAEKRMAHKRDGNSFLNVTLADKTGQIKGVAWDHVAQIAEAAVAGDFVHIAATAGEYRGGLQLVIKAMTAVASDQVSPEDFLPTTTRNVDQMFLRLTSLTDTITTPCLAQLMTAFWSDDALVQQFKRAPAAKMMHHAYIGGLLEHTLSMALLVDKIAGHYNGVDRDLLLVGAVLHDIGKVRELSYSHRIDYTDEGRLLSHIVIGLEMVEAKITALADFPKGPAALIKHMVVSHHGAREFGSPEPPKTIEAVLLNYIDEMDSRLNAIREFMAGEDPKAAWTPYHRLLERHFYKGTPDASGE